MSREQAAKKLRNDVLIGLAGLLAALITLALTGGKGILGILLPFAEAMVVVFSLTQGVYHWRVKTGLTQEGPVQGPDAGTLTPLPPVSPESAKPADEPSAEEPGDSPVPDGAQDEGIPRQATFCPFCGEKLLKSGGFCPRCGKQREE